MTDFRALCAELIHLDDEQPSDYADWKRRWNAVANRARAALAELQGEGPKGRPAPPLALQPMRRIYINNPTQIAECGGPCTEGGPKACDCGALWRDEPALAEPHGDGPKGRPTPPSADGEVGEGPTDQELLGWMPQRLRADPATSARQFARAYLAEPVEDGPAVPEGREPASVDQQATAGEVGELVAALRSEAIHCTCSTLTSGDLRRAADLLTHLALQPVPVAERLPGPEDCDAEGRCWFGTNITSSSYVPTRWELVDRTYGINTCYETWLPAHALPLPREVQP